MKFLFLCGPGTEGQNMNNSVDSLTMSKLRQSINKNTQFQYEYKKVLYYMVAKSRENVHSCILISFKL